MKKVLVFGTFDILHPGHLNFFKQAKKYGDFLIVTVARDKNVRKIKGHLPRHNEKKRLENLRQVKNVDRVVLGYIRNPYKIIEKIKPDVICLGYDQNSFTDNLAKELKARKISCRRVRLKSFKPEKYKSSKMQSEVDLTLEWPQIV